MLFRKELVAGTTGTLILAILKRSAAHGYEIVQRVNEQSDGALQWREGTIYPALHKLEKAGLIAGAWQDGINGKQRRVYTLTEKGNGVLSTQSKEWKTYAGAVGLVLEANHA